MFHQKKTFQNEKDIHQYYMGILNSLPNIAYWINLDCSLMGCNSKFVNLLGIKHIQEFSGTPYDQMSRHLPWSAERIKLFMQADMNVLYSGKEVYDVEESPVYNKDGDEVFYSVSRIPLLDSDKVIYGLVVFWTDITAQVNMRKLLNQPDLKQKHTPNIARFDTPVRILLVEDNEVAQNTEQNMLLDLNCEVAVAGNGADAITLFLPGKYDLVFMDITLPDTNGYIVSRELRAIEKNTEHKTTIIGLTTYDAKVVKYDCTSYGMDGVLTKPLTSTQAMQVIKHFIYREEIDVDGLETR